MSKNGVIVWAASVTFIAGVAGGLAIGARRDRPNQSAGVLQSPVGQNDSGGSPGNSSLAEPADENPQSAPETEMGVSSEVLKIAQELWDLMTSQDGTRAAHNERRARVRDLKPEMAEFFIRKFRELSGSMKSDRQMAMEMAIACGGPSAVNFVRELGENPAEGFQEFLLRTVAADVLSQGDLMRRPKEFPVDEALLQQTQVLLNSSRGSDRRLAVTILGHADVHLAVPMITERLQADPDPVVREAAVRELGRMGNEASLALLRTQGTAIADQIFATYKQPEPVRGGPPVRVSERRGFLRTLNDAIEELEERLQPK